MGSSAQSPRCGRITCCQRGVRRRLGRSNSGTSIHGNFGAACDGAGELNLGPEGVTNATLAIGVLLLGSVWFSRLAVVVQTPLARVLVPPLALVLVPCLLYTSDAADEEDSVDLGGRRIIKKKKT
eukprot:TRINITY_DN50278_c0_g1_i1.p3 TRINITY_DN50278_c0_g1~~TRINITY_DN50278_c0_g1_i1.p3  ORF type:complete len:125 (+),score=15.80 TRINITY_DN50278_c0_g1_i1:395-769(+)